MTVLDVSAPLAAPPAPRRALRLRLTLSARLLLLGLLGLFASALVALLALHQIHAAAASAAQSLATHTATTLALQIQYTRDTAAGSGPGMMVEPAQRLIDFIHQREGRDLELIDPALRDVADADHADIGKRLDGENAAVISATLADGQPRTFDETEATTGATLHQIVVAVAGGEGKPAAFALVFEYNALLDEMNAAAAAHTRMMLLATVPAGLALLLVALWIVRSIALPVRRLQAATLSLAQGGRTPRGAVHANDELGDLARSFDRMVEHLEAADDALRAEMAQRRQAQDEVLAANAELEQRVLERTAKLQETNQRLDGELAQRLHAERQLEQLARFDPLTGLPNRGLFLQRLEQAILRGRRSGKLVGLMFVDLDRFKSVNDGLGHAIGDGVLLEVATRMVAVMRETDTVSRIGGDEFTVVVENIDEVCSLAAIASKLIEAFSRPLSVDGIEVFVTLSVGIAISPLDSSESDELMRQADFAMYQAKAEGGDAFRFHTERMGEAARRRLAIEHALRHALERREFTVHYQVRVGARTMQPVGMEALLRWNSAELGPVRPDEFIPIAESIGIIMALGEWVLHTACAQHTAWRLEGLHPGVMGVNVSARQFREPDFVATVARIAAQAGIAPQQLELEVTESLLMCDPESASLQMSQLREIGFGIAIDDFGTGYSSLNHLKHFPATKIKIDRSFVRSIDTDPDDSAIAAAIVALAKAVGILVTAEGVETEAQLAHLAQLECSEYQGYLFSEPLPSQGMGEVLRRGLAVPAEEPGRPGSRP